jgi:P27 family predicted phage terminase small subunit
MSISKLSNETRRWHDEMASTWAFESHHLKLLLLACEAWDRAKEAQTAIDKEGLTYIDRWGSPHPRPEVKIKENATAQFAQIIKQLGLDLDEAHPVGRPPGH